VDAFTLGRQGKRKVLQGNRSKPPTFNVGLATEEAEAAPLYYKQEGSVISSFVQIKGCFGQLTTS
jgi:hypothetical protein